MSKNRQRSPSGSSSKSPIDVLIAKYGLVGTLTASLLGVVSVGITAYFGYLGIKTQIEGPIRATETAEAESTALVSLASATAGSVTLVTATPTLSPATTSPALLRTPIPAVTVPPFPSASVSAPTLPEAGTPVSPSVSSGFGNVSFDELTKECDFVFNMYDADGDKVINEGKTSTGALIGAGTYDIGLLRYSGGWSLSGRYEFMRIENVNIQEGQNTVDLTQRIGAILISSHPTFNTKVLGFDLYQAGTKVIYGGPPGGESNELYCLPAGPYKTTPLVVGGLAFDIVIEAGKKKDLAPEVWKHLGRLSVLSAENLNLKFQVYDQATGNYVTDAGVGFWGQGWFVAGRYRIVLTEPYPGVTYENVEIKAGEETVLQLPSSP